MRLNPTEDVKIATELGDYPTRESLRPAVSTDNAAAMAATAAAGEAADGLGFDDL